MKRKIIVRCTVFALILGFIGLTFILSGDKQINYGMLGGAISFTEGEADITDQVIGSDLFTVDENDKFVFSLDSSANPVIKDKSSGRVWCAVAEDDGGNSKYSSALILKYFSDNSTEITLYSSEHCVDKNQVKVFTAENGIKVEYIFGEISESYIYPETITEKRMEGFISELSTEDAEYLLRRYKLYTLEEYDKTEQKYLLKQYPELKKENLYVLTDISTKLIKRKTDEILRKAGYTEQDKLIDSGNKAVETVNSQTFKVVLNYSLTENGFEVKINSDELKYYSDYPLTNINVLPYFDSFSSNDSGYFVLPSGSGALMEVNRNEKEATLSIPVYGENISVTERLQDSSQSCILPYFGQYKNKSGFLCVLNDGAQQAEVSVDRNKLSSGTSADFTLIDNSDYTMSSSNPVQLFANGECAQEFSAEYILFSEMNEETAYSQMATCYRNILLKNGALKEKTASDKALLVAELVGSINYDTSALGFIPVNREMPLTDFEGMERISGELYEMAGNGLKLIISGWSAKGVDRQHLGKLNFSSKLGGMSGYEELRNKLKACGVESFLDLKLSLTEQFFNDGFSVSSQASRGINNSIVRLKEYDALTNDYTVAGFVPISSRLYAPVMKKYIKNTALSGGGISVSELSMYLYSDYTDGELITRGDSIENVSTALKQAAEYGISITGKGGNLYTLDKLSLITDVSVKASGKNVFSRDIPFVQMVLHGYKNYTSNAVNDSESLNKTVLKLIETGSGLYYRLTETGFDKLFDTEYSYLYNTVYSDLKPRIFEAYDMLSTALDGLGSQTITEHKYLTSDVVSVKYECGTVIYINYSTESFDNGSVRLEPMSYLRVD